jgi:xylan 1,4-beta-xylosidase
VALRGQKSLFFLPVIVIFCPRHSFGRNPKNNLTDFKIIIYIFAVEKTRSSYMLKWIHIFFKKMFFLIILVSFFSGHKIIAEDNKSMQESYLNPIMAGFYPDPSICRVGEDYYLINSTFAYFPGIPIFHSKDLVHWQQIGHVLDRQEQLDLDGLGVSEGVFAPAIRYHQGTFYLTNTIVGGGGNFIVTARDPAGPWSDPIWLPDVVGIDPSPFFDDNGKCYIIYNGDPPQNKSLYDGHRAIWMVELDLQAMKTSGEKQLLVNGGTDISKNPVWIEGPHIFKKDGYYYLIAAEGGTGINHSQVVFRSRNVTGLYENFKGNPILTQRHLDPKRANPVTCTGHADFVETPNGEWWALFLACRPYQDDHYNTGRETFMAPLKWIDGWPIINPGSETVLYSYPVPNLKRVEVASFPLHGNFTLRDDFDLNKLAYYWIFLRTPVKKWYDLKQYTWNLRIKLQPQELGQKENPAFIGRRQQHLNCTASAALAFNPKAENETAGIAAFQNESHYYYLGKTVSGGKPVIRLEKAGGESLEGHVHKVRGTIPVEEDTLIYQSERWARKLYYSIPVQKGQEYQVTLKFAEMYWESEGVRSFDVLIEDKEIKDIDVYRKTRSRFIPFDTTLNVMAGSDQLNISFKANKDNACICGIVVKDNSGNIIAAMNCGGDEFTSQTGICYKSDLQYLLKKKPEAGKILKEIILDPGLQDKKIYLKIEAKGKYYAFYYAVEPGQWQTVLQDVDGTYLSTAAAGGFVGVILGMYASSQGKESNNYADYDWFEYSGNDRTFIRGNLQGN